MGDNTRNDKERVTGWEAIGVALAYIAIFVLIVSVVPFVMAMLIKWWVLIFGFVGL